MTANTRPAPARHFAMIPAAGGGASRWLAIALGLLSMHGASARTPFQARCEDEIGQTAAVVSSQQNGYAIHTKLSYKTLSTIRGAARANTYLLGLTKTEVRMEFGLDEPMLTDPATGDECVAPQITVKLSYAPIVIYVGREFAAGTCKYEEILAHEMRHMQLYMDHLPKAEAAVRAALTERFQGKPVYATHGGAKVALRRELSDVWMPFIRNEMAKVEAQQADIDSEEEYARLARQCNGEMRHIIYGTRLP